MNTGKLLLGVLAGVATGAVLGILFAPDKGCNTRKKILNKGEDYADALKEKFDGMLDAIADKFEDTKAQADEWVSKGKTKYDEVKQDVKEVIA
jgi:gas vesicle protein